MLAKSGGGKEALQIRYRAQSSMSSGAIIFTCKAQLSHLSLGKLCSVDSNPYSWENASLDPSILLVLLLGREEGSVGDSNIYGKSTLVGIDQGLVAFLTVSGLSKTIVFVACVAGQTSSLGFCSDSRSYGLVGRDISFYLFVMDQLSEVETSRIMQSLPPVTDRFLLPFQCLAAMSGSPVEPLLDVRVWLDGS